MSRSATIEEYLETIARLSELGAGVIRPSQIADGVGVSRPSVTTALQRMEVNGLIERHGRGVLLTEAGKAAAFGVLRRHRVSEQFLVEVLGLDAEGVHEDACLLEHALSDRVLEAMEREIDRKQQANR